MIRIYRGYHADTAAMHARYSDAVFATLKGQSDQQAPLQITPHASQQASPQASQHQYPQCICGQYHYFSKCWYLKQSKRPPNWIPRPDIQARFHQILAGPPTPAKRAIQQAMEDDTPPPAPDIEHLMAIQPLQGSDYGFCQPELVVDLRNYGEGQRYGEILQDSAIGDPQAHKKFAIYFLI
jgi:hypothetical protein